ncbi:MAG: DUF3810 domain-containing protein [Bacteroidales bacterium]
MIEYYAHHIYPAIASVLSRISGLVPFSFSALLLILVVLLYLFKLAQAIRQKRGIRCLLLRLTLPLILAVSWMYATWGVLYFRDSWYQRTGIEKAAPDSVAYLQFLDHYIENLNRSYTQSRTSPLLIPISATQSHTSQAHTSKILTNQPPPAETRQTYPLPSRATLPDSAMQPLSDPIAADWWGSEQAVAADALIEQAYQTIGTRLGIAYPNGKRRPKKVFMEWYYTRTSILGYFLPFFHEIHLNPRQPWLQYPASLAHEKAHQFGITSEAECNFYGYLACIASTDPFIQYSGYFSVLGYIAADARRLLPATYRTHLANIEPGIRQESALLSAYWKSQQHEKLSRIQNKVYDTYLKANRIPTGIKNYSEVTALLLTYHSAVR